MPAAGHRSRYASSTTRARRVGQEGLGLPAQGTSRRAATWRFEQNRPASCSFLSTHFNPRTTRGLEEYYNVAGTGECRRRADREEQSRQAPRVRGGRLQLDQVGRSHHATYDNMQDAGYSDRSGHYESARRAPGAFGQERITPGRPVTTCTCQGARQSRRRQRLQPRLHFVSPMRVSEYETVMTPIRPGQVGRVIRPTTPHAARQPSGCPDRLRPGRTVGLERDVAAPHVRVGTMCGAGQRPGSPRRRRRLECP